MNVVSSLEKQNMLVFGNGPPRYSSWRSELDEKAAQVAGSCSTSGSVRGELTNMRVFINDDSTLRWV